MSCELMLVIVMLTIFVYAAVVFVMLEKTNKDIFVVRTAIKAFTIIVIAVMALTIITEIIIKEPYMVRTSVIIYETNAIINKAGTIDTIKIHGTIKITSDSGKGR